MKEKEKKKDLLEHFKKFNIYVEYAVVELWSEN
jgi:hypothetical protein